jgi:phage terminase large subunit-like protein
MVISTAVPDWQDRILAGRSLVPTIPLNTELADRAERVFRRLRLPDVLHRPRIGDSGCEWFIPIVRALFGAYDPDVDSRTIQEVFLLVPKKNAKTTLAAALMVTALIVNLVPNAEAQLIAPTKMVADLAFGQAKGMIRADPELLKKFHIQDHTKRITHRESAAFLQVKAADTDAITGSKAHYTLIDETHVFGSHAGASGLFVEIRGALASRPGGFLFQISTQSKSPPAGVFRAELDRARAVRDGRVQAPLLAVLYELPPSMQAAAKDGEPAPWEDPATFGLVNPNLNRSTSADYIARALASAREEGPAALALVASQHLNIEVGIGLNADGWAGAEFWSRGKGGPATLAELIARCEVITIGIDGGGLDDLLGIGVIGRESGDGEAAKRRWFGWAHAVITPEGLSRRKQNAPLYADFARAGDLTITSPDIDDLEVIKAIVEQADASGKLAQVGVDNAGIGSIVDMLAEIDITADNGALTAVGQGIRLMGASKTIERRLRTRSFLHGNGTMLGWCASNAKTRQTSTASLIERAASGYGKIDPLMALFNAAELMSRHPSPRQKVGQPGLYIL